MARVNSLPGAVRRRVQRGVSLLFALIALLAMTLAAMALVRSVDTGSSVLGNVGFKQDATVLGDQIIDQAVTWVGAQSTATLNATHAPSTVDPVAYYATSLAGLDATGQQVTSSTRTLIDWDANQCSGASNSLCVAATTAFAWPPAPGNYATVSYVITRLCSANGPSSAAANNCQMPAQATSNSANKGQLSYAGYTRLGVAGGPYYRIVVRIVGARNTTSFLEAIVHF